MPGRHNSLIVRIDGTLAPCFPMYSAGYDWGMIEDHKFETKQLTEMKALPAALLFHLESHSGVLLQRSARHRLDVKAGEERFSGRHRQLRGLTYGD